MTWLKALTLDTVVVHTRDGYSMRGVKVAVHDDCIVLRDVMVLETESPQEIVNGMIVVPRENVSFMQLIAANGAA